MTNQLEYKVRYSTPAQPYNIHRDIVSADSLEQVCKMFDGLRVIEIDLVIDPEYTEALLAAFDADQPMLETIQARQERLEKELAGPVSKERADAILNELAEIETWFEREMIFNHGEVYEQARRFQKPL